MDRTQRLVLPALDLAAIDAPTTGGGSGNEGSHEVDVSDDLADVPEYIRQFLEKVGNCDPGSSAKSALCISGGLLSKTIEHVAVDSDAAVEQRQMYLHFLGRDELELLVQELTLNIQRSLGGAPLSRTCSHALAVRIGDGPWVHGVRAGAVLTLGRHPRCGLQIADASASFVSRLQCILVRARGRLVVYDMCSLNGTQASTRQRRASLRITCGMATI